MWWRRWWWLLRTRCFALCAEREFFLSLDMLQDISEQCLHTNINILLITLQNKQVIFIRFHFSSPRHHPFASMSINLAACSSVGAMISLFWIRFHFGRKKTLLNFDNSDAIDLDASSAMKIRRFVFFGCCGARYLYWKLNISPLICTFKSEISNWHREKSNNLFSIVKSHARVKSVAASLLHDVQQAMLDAGVARLSRRKKWLIERQIHRDYADALLFLYAVSPARDLSPRDNWCIIMIFLPIISL